jgi:hypothetical protein
VTPRSRLLCCLAAAALALSAIPTSAQAVRGDVREANARPNHFQSAKGAVMYVPTKAIVIDAKSHQARKPTATEVDQLMVTIKPLANQGKAHQAQKTASGSLSLHIGDSNDYVVLARPAANGTVRDALRLDLRRGGRVSRSEGRGGGLAGREAVPQRRAPLSEDNHQCEIPASRTLWPSSRRPSSRSRRPRMPNAHITIVNVNVPNVGFNDPTPAAPVGGNPGTTLGQQRLNVFQHVADIWGATLDSNVTIRVRASMVPLGTNVLGSTGVLDWESNFPGTGLLYPGALVQDTWYPKALADKLAGVDLFPSSEDYVMQFSSTFDFYLGLDNNHGVKNDLVAVLLHEFAHGLGFSSAVTRTGVNAGRFLGAPFLPDIYSSHMFDNTLGLHWNNETTQAQRRTSLTNWGNVVWDGETVTNDLPDVLSLGSPEVRLTSPASIAGVYEFGTASFGAVLTSPGISGPVVAAVDPADGAGPTTTDGCSPFTNAADVAGKIALVERGTCTFIVKAQNATAAGAAAVLIYNNAANAAAAAPALGGTDTVPPTVTIVALGLGRATGLAIVNQLLINNPCRPPSESTTTSTPAPTRSVTPGSTCPRSSPAARPPRTTTRSPSATS